MLTSCRWDGQSVSVGQLLARYCYWLAFIMCINQQPLKGMIISGQTIFQTGIMQMLLAFSDLSSCVQNNSVWNMFMKYDRTAKSRHHIHKYCTCMYILYTMTFDLTYLQIFWLWIKLFPWNCCVFQIMSNNLWFLKREQYENRFQSVEILKRPSLHPHVDGKTWHFENG